MLPFLNKKKLSAVIMAKRHSDGSTEPMHEEGDHEPEMHQAAEHMISAVHAKDSGKVAEAMKMAHAHLSKDKSNAPDEK